MTVQVPASPDDEPAYDYVNEPPAGVSKTNVGAETHPSGFQLINYPSVEKDFLDEEKIMSVYYAEVEEILKKYAAAKRVFIFDHTTRRNYDDGALQQTPFSQSHCAWASQEVHVDQISEAAAQRVKLHPGNDAERLPKWRHPVADYRSLDPKADLVFTCYIYPTRESSGFHYLLDQIPDEVILIKCFDSDVDKARLTPHLAFKDDSSPKEAPLRQSIEVRPLVFDMDYAAWGCTAV
ncbi:hypothetical protein F5I97DRAFT_1937347 [Phlebopus sp. FC_14]|nr:hypothetical protein F5I97DRAFT_1937347 [Phlebopus sp. FC_14]